MSATRSGGRRPGARRQQGGERPRPAPERGGPALTGPGPLQLDLFAPPPERWTLRDAPSVAAAVSRALGQGRTVGLLRAHNRFELLVARGGSGHLLALELPLRLGAPCGFSRRAVQLLVRGVAPGERGLWARPAGGAWEGWTEWGELQWLAAPQGARAAPEPDGGGA